MTPTPDPRNSQPELRDVIADAINELLDSPGFRGGQPPETVTPDEVSIACQRTVRQVHTLNSKLDGADLSACIVIVRKGGGSFPWFFLTCRLPDGDRWLPLASVGGEHKPADEPYIGKLRGPRSFIAIGALNAIQDGGGIRIELPDGNTYEDCATNGCCIALAPLTFPPEIGELTTIRYLNPDGSERGSENVHA